MVLFNVAVHLPEAHARNDIGGDVLRTGWGARSVEGMARGADIGGLRLRVGDKGRGPFGVELRDLGVWNWVGVD